MVEDFTCTSIPITVLMFTVEDSNSFQRSSSGTTFLRFSLWSGRDESWKCQVMGPSLVVWCPFAPWLKQPKATSGYHGSLNHCRSKQTIRTSLLLLWECVGWWLQWLQIQSHLECNAVTKIGSLDIQVYFMQIHNSANPTIQHQVCMVYNIPKCIIRQCG